ncbi:hypothetical protein J1G42_07290 [Cellulomonas sp. zg-ZUI222]|uniref:DUF4190 domain-containing protein n=1 Tax=Cellulomonas wangleii TaxID=2816956 RepID=A0ABX8D1L5_9CELL|nr:MULTISPECIES: hypothetical protein [Cellulomonas]MBO0899766.1 hypothetical protein [Cellulomonas sp. zg-ZUI22]MBO0920628.1 hypothetical protein [Cellulomonas wangleii]MBO0922954.1 hypothetical protein [Cellulomonas wangleii]QVI61348.1 hypothetical protein KG103_12750 [Cellulomonas wangleii]
MGNPWAPPERSTTPDHATQDPAAAGQPAQDPTAGQPAPTHQPRAAHGAGLPGGPATPDPAAPGGPWAPHPGAPVPAEPPHGTAPHGTPPHGTPPDPAGVARATRTAAWSAAALLVAVLLTGSPYPGMLAAPLASVAGLVLAILAVVRAAGAHGRGPVIALPVVLLVAALGWTVISSASLLYVGAARDYQQCEAAALTQQAQRACAQQLEEDMSERLGSMAGLVDGGRARP